MRAPRIASLIAVALLALTPGLALRPASARPRPTPSASPIPAEIPAVHELAIRQLVHWQLGDVDRTLYSASFNQQISDASIKKISLELARKGTVLSVVYLGPVQVHDSPPGVQSYQYKMICQNGPLYERISLDAAGKVAGILFEDKLDDSD